MWPKNDKKTVFFSKFLFGHIFFGFWSISISVSLKPYLKFSKTLILGVYDVFRWDLGDHNVRDQCKLYPYFRLFSPCLIGILFVLEFKIVFTIFSHTHILWQKYGIKATHGMSSSGSSSPNRLPAENILPALGSSSCYPCSMFPIHPLILPIWFLVLNMFTQIPPFIFLVVFGSQSESRGDLYWCTRYPRPHRKKT